MKWIILICWITGTDYKCDEPIPQKDYTACMKASAEIIKKDRNVMVWCKPKPAPKTYDT